MRIQDLPLDLELTSPLIVTGPAKAREIFVQGGQTWRDSSLNRAICCLASTFLFFLQTMHSQHTFFARSFPSSRTGGAGGVYQVVIAVFRKKSISYQKRRIDN